MPTNPRCSVLWSNCVSLFPLSCSLAMKIINTLSSKNMLPRTLLFSLQLILSTLPYSLFPFLSLYLSFFYFVLPAHLLPNCSFKASHPSVLVTGHFHCFHQSGVVVVVVVCLTTELWQLLLSEGFTGPLHTNKRKIPRLLHICLFPPVLKNTQARLIFSVSQ